MEAVKRQKMRVWRRKAGLFLVDMVFVVLSFAIAVAFERPEKMAACFAWVMGSYAVALWGSGTYGTLWASASTFDTLRIALPMLAATAVTMIANIAMHLGATSAMLVMVSMFSLYFCCGHRFLRRAWRMGTKPAEKNKENRILIVGAGEGAGYAISICNNMNLGKPVVMVDDDPMKQNFNIQKVPIRGYLDDIPMLIEQYRIQEIVVGILSLKEEKMRKIVSAAYDAKCQIRVLAHEQKPQVLGLRKLNVLEFLFRKEVELNTDKINGYLAGKTVLVTGGGGSIGSELCRQIMRFSPKLLLVFDVYENCAYELQCELMQKYPINCPITVLVGSVQDRHRVNEVMDMYSPDVVFHAAAHKHVPLMEESPAEAVKNNVFGTRNVLESASAHGVSHFVALSSDKAVNPTNVMGATKRITEMLVQYYAANVSMKCMAVRFGNVLGSHGSVIPLFESQIQRGGPVTVTDKHMERFFMTIPEAAQLVLQAGSLAQSGAIYMLDMGQPIRIMELAEKVIRYYGYTPGMDMKIVETGLRPGEKMIEELLTDAERNAMTLTEHGKIFIAPPIPLKWMQFTEQLEELKRASAHNDEAVVELLERVVPTYTPNRLQKTG